MKASRRKSKRRNWKTAVKHMRYHRGDAVRVSARTNNLTVVKAGTHYLSRPIVMRPGGLIKGSKNNTARIK